ncbi:hypothetical protein RJT34_29870 [Clitoria ternatea]|uniref:Uncharacterized protein n=1 Tax=Clitoria ternatea TaxID=43366 RepID=A0AAN9ERD1_CLITE
MSIQRNNRDKDVNAPKIIKKTSLPCFSVFVSLSLSLSPSLSLCSHFLILFFTLLFSLYSLIIHSLILQTCLGFFFIFFSLLLPHFLHKVNSNSSPFYSFLLPQALSSFFILTLNASIKNPP